MATIDLRRLFPAAADGTHSPLPKQSAFLSKVLDAEGPQYIAYYGGFGSGKSVVLCTAIITQAVLYGGDYLISRHFMPELRRTTMKTFIDMCPPELVIEKKETVGEVYLRSRNGVAVVYFIGLDEPGKIDSMNLSGFAIDEASQTTEEAFLKLQGRLRNTKGLRKGLLVGNPKGRDHVYRYFVSKVALKAIPPCPEYPEGRSLEEVKADYCMIVAPSTENKHLPRGYVANMLGTYSKERIQRDIMGSFDSFEGMIYSEFNRSTHVVEPYTIPDGWTRIIGQDDGFTNPAASIFGAVDENGDIVIYDEVYIRETVVEDLVKKHINPKIGSQKISGVYIDPSTKARRNQAGGVAYSNFSVYLDNLPKSVPLICANNDVSVGIDRVKTFLKVNPKTKKPKITIFDTCVNLLEEIGEYRWAELSANQEGTKNQKEEPRKYNDHAMDALRYLIMSRPDPSKAFKDPKNPEFPTLQAAIKRDFDNYRKPKEKDPFGDY
jgi:PBSX family phage terminase large subunit